MGNYTLEELNATNIVAANNLTTKPGQEEFMVPPSYAIADAIPEPATTWFRVALDGTRVIGFVRANFNPNSNHDEFKSCLWRINVDAAYQGKGVGKFLVDSVIAEAKSRGNQHLNVLWERGDAGPEEFFHRVGFADTGSTPYGEVIGEIKF